MPGKQIDPETNEPILERFSDNPERDKQYQVWLEQRSIWVERQILTARTRELFTDAANPNAIDIAHQKISAASESPFEKAVATALSDRGYHLVQQWKVGAYRLDIVAVCAGKTVAIECDGERWHSGDAKIREDMERQTILERLGWRFIRIRGSEYYRAPEKTIERVVSELTQYGIVPESVDSLTPDSRDTELLSRVKNLAGIILSNDICSPESESKTIAAALNPIPLQEPESIAISQLVPEGKDISKPVSEGYSEKQRAVRTEKVENTIPVKVPTRKPEKKFSPALQKQPTILREPVFVPGIAGPELKTSTGEQQVIRGMEDVLPNSGDIIALLKKCNVRYVDKRSRNGALWLIGGSELKPVIEEAKALGFYFQFKESGGKATKGAPGWWAK
ncbi:MAG: DUF559 domain-containing protein [Faecousia sp.]